MEDESAGNKRTEIVRVQLGDKRIVQVEARAPEGDRDVSFGVMDFSGVTDAIESIAQDLQAVLVKVKPKKASVEFGLEVGVESGKLTALLVKGTGKANLKVTLTWE